VPELPEFEWREAYDLSVIDSTSLDKKLKMMEYTLSCAFFRSKPMDQLTFAATNYRALRDRIRAHDPQIDEQTLADTVEGLTDLHEILAAVLRAALADEAMATGLKCRISDMQDRLARLQDRAAKRRQIAKDAMVELDLKKLAAPDFTASLRPGMPALVVLNEDAVPKTYWEPGEPRLRRQILALDLKEGAEVAGATLSNPEPVLSVRVR
jgi:hypothetical protein